ALDRLNRAQEAGREYEQALDCAGDDPLWLREAGRFYFQTGDFQRAADLLQKAAVKSPKDFMTLYYLARLQASTGDRDAAEATMRRVLSLNGQNADAHYHLGRILGERNRLFEAYLHLAYAAIYNNEKKQARQHVARAESLARSAEHKALFDELHELYTSRQEYWSGQEAS
ncbi:MAG: tetratricopeptide repeat protein, partial [Desulfovibrionales bacterium]